MLQVRLREGSSRQGMAQCLLITCRPRDQWESLIYSLVQDAHGITETPCALIYKDGKLVKKVPGMAPSEMKEVGQMLSA